MLYFSATAPPAVQKATDRRQVRFAPVAREMEQNNR
jgi:hypothetical protein